MSGRILAGSLVPEPKSSLKCSIAAQAGGAQPCGARLDVGLIDGMPLPSHARAVRARGREDCRGELREGHIRVEWRMGGECGNAISVG